MRAICRALPVFLLLLVAGAVQAEVGTPPRHDFPAVGPYQVLSGDFHMHTLNSDGKLTTRERVEESYNFGYDVIAVTDHGTPRAYRIARNVGQRLGMVVVRGYETGVAKNEHMNAIGVTADLKPRNPHNWSETPGQNNVYYQEQLKAIAGCGGLVIYNHPHVGWREPVRWGVGQGIIQGIEVKNGVVGKAWNTIEWNGIYCYPNAFDWALEHNLTLFANSDVHGARNGVQPVTLVFVTEKTAEGTMEALKSRRTVAWFEGHLWGRQALLADLLAASVTFKRESDGSVRIANNCPVELKARLAAATVTLKPYAETLVSSTREIDTVTWENVWINPRENLQTKIGG